MIDDVLRSALDRLDGAIQDARWPQPGGAGLRGNTAALMAREPAARKTVDGMCRAWVAGGTLPALLDHAATGLFYARLVEAHALGAWLRENGFDAPDVGVEPLLELLLIDYWKSFVALGWRAAATRERPS